MNLPVDPLTARSWFGAMVKTGIAGALGQGVFSLLHHHLSYPFPLARSIAFLVAGLIVGLAASGLTPYMPRRRAALVGSLLAGLPAWMAFGQFLGAAEPLARMASLLLLAGLMSLAVVFPLQPEAVTATTEAEGGLPGAANPVGPKGTVCVPGVRCCLLPPGRVPVYRQRVPTAPRVPIFRYRSGGYTKRTLKNPSCSRRR
jgi:hypothetical protein